MQKLSKKEQQQIKGGISIWGILSLIASLIFSIGTLDGIVKPGKCNQ